MGGEFTKQHESKRPEEIDESKRSELERNIREQHETSIEATSERARQTHETEQNIEQEAKREAQAVAEHAPAKERRQHSPAERRKDAPSKAERAQAYDRIMKDARVHMSPASKSFSSFIHNPVVEKASDSLGATIARPNAILAGSISAFVLTLGVYLVARYYGYPLSGLETIVAFVLGWIIGLVLDYFKAMATGGR